MNEKQKEIHEEIVNAPAHWVSGIIDANPEMHNDTLQYIVDEKPMHPDYFPVRIRAKLVLRKRETLIMLGGIKVTRAEAYSNNLV